MGKNNKAAILKMGSRLCDAITMRNGVMNHHRKKV